MKLMNERGVSNEGQCTDEHVEAAAGTVQQLRAEVSSSSGSLGEGTDEWNACIKAGILSPNWTVNLVSSNGNTESTSSGEEAA